MENTKMKDYDAMTTKELAYALRELALTMFSLGDFNKQRLIEAAADRLQE